MEESILKTIEKYSMIESGDKLVLGVSGGPDSICMLDCFYHLKENLPIEIYVAHINHGIRKEAEEDEKYVEEYCRKRKIPFFVRREQVLEIAKKEKLSTEEAGRKVRYSFFEEVLKQTASQKIATAHTANDNAETVLMNLLRGCGTARIKRD